MDECRYCNEPMDDPAEHHLEQHPNRRFDPVWYLSNDDWNETNDPEKIITDAEIERGFQNANYGDWDHREILFSGLMKVMAGYGTGHTTEQILREMGLAHGDPSRGDGELTERAKYYLFHVVSGEMNVIL